MSVSYWYILLSFVGCDELTQAPRVQLIKKHRSEVALCQRLNMEYRQVNQH